jgi:lipoate-protein ligase A
MKYIDWSPPAPAENLAADEALLDLCEAGQCGELLRFSETSVPFVVLGYANHAALEANLPACRAANIPVLRRCTGGGTVLQGPGCLSYSLFLEIREQSPTETITSANRYIMERNQSALAPLLSQSVTIKGHTDLALADLKFSGNAQRRRRKFLIFHGTFLLDFDLPLVEKFLRMPSQQPDYRHDRPHSAFITNLHVSPDAVKLALRESWRADTEAHDLPLANFPALVQKYSSDEWNFKF